MERKKNLFYVKGKPFIALAGEAHNSSSSTAYYMQSVWEKAKEQGLNTVLLPVTWELVEPQEGVFDFKTQDEIIAQARENDMHIIFLWFGSWKNAQCTYAPEWVKKDLVRFPRAQVEKGKNKCSLSNFYGMSYTSLSYLGEETCKADARAFAKFMEHLKEMDGQEQTVIAVQVENETGLQGAARENSELADRLFAGEVPQEFAAYMRSHTSEMAEDVKASVEAGISGKTWAEVFGNAAEEIFSAYYIASYVNYVAEAGKAVYDLPMSANCWLDKGEEAGKYPSGGPVARVMEVWKFAAPAIDMIAPDIYVQNFCEICDAYTKLDNPLFIPETATHSHVGPRLVYTVGHHHAICFAPFGFEDMGQEFTDTQSYLFGVDVDDPLLKTPQDVQEYRWYNKVLSVMTPMLADKYGTKDLQAVISERPEENSICFEKYGFMAIFNYPMIARKDGVLLALSESEDTFYLIANACAVMPFSADQSKPNVDLLVLEEGYFDDGKWVMTRRLNGDEAAFMKYEKPTLLKVKLFSYQ